MPADIAVESPPAALHGRLRELVADQQWALPVPGRGMTLLRWQKLAQIAAEDVSLVKLYEAHCDGLAIMAELSPAHSANLNRPGEVWAVWAAEPPDARVTLHRTGTGVVLTGRKSWCSGADVATRALVTAWDTDGRQCLVAVALDGAGVTVTQDGWHAVGMGRVASGDVLFEHAAGTEIGRPGEYTARPGFWHGGAGIAACWYGGALPFAQALAAAVARRGDPHAAAHLAVVDIALRGLRALLTESASWIDAHPEADAQAVAMRVRAAAEETASLISDRAGRVLGAGPLCRDAAMAQRYADLPVFLRQSHAERDLAELGVLTAGRLAGGDLGWQL
ncbi:acyl-CoA dehydrogenase family protein [soil metagenome]